MARIDHDTIVVGLDSSKCSDDALDWAIDEAKRSGRHLLLVHAWHWSSDAIGSPLSLAGQDDSRTAGSRILIRAAKHAELEGVPASTLILEGVPAKALADTAKQGAMLVVGRHGGSMRRSLMGSVSRGCLKDSSVPVVVVPAPRPIADR